MLEIHNVKRFISLESEYLNGDPYFSEDLCIRNNPAFIARI